MSLGTVGADVAHALGIAHAVRMVGSPRSASPWASPLPVISLARDSVALASLAIDAVRSARTGAPSGTIHVDDARVAVSFTSERALRIDGNPPAVWAPLSGFWPARERFVRTHANYPHHERALRGLLGIGETDDADAVGAAIAAWDAEELETAAARVGAIVGAVRNREQWAALAQGRVVAESPLVAVNGSGDAAPRGWTTSATPLGGIRVLDLTRVLAGPIAARDLALGGAEVLRVDAPFLPETPWIHLDTGQGKRSTLLDLGRRADRATFDALLDAADVVLTGYRPGALDRFGLSPAELADRHPGLVTGSVSAWGTHGPWAERRGFDSIVQAVTGIAMRASADGATPGALPAQALDHSTGHFLAAALATALREQRATGRSIDVRMSLARVAHALLGSPDGASVPREPSDENAHIRTRALAGPAPMQLTYAAPVLAFRGAPDDYPVVGGGWGADTAHWTSVSDG